MTRSVSALSRCVCMLLAVCAIVCAIEPPSASAQVQSVVAPVFGAADGLGVDVSTGQFNLTSAEVAIGQAGAGGVSFSRHWIGSGWRDSLAGTISSSGSVYTVSVGAASESFTLSGGTFTSSQKVGSTLAFNSGTNKYTYTTSDGTAFVFNKYLATAGSVTVFWSSNEGAIESITRPNGDSIGYLYNSASVGGLTAWRPQGVYTNTGYMIHFTYANNSPATTSELLGAFLARTKTTGINTAVYNCSASSFTCSDSTGGNWPYVTYGTESGGAVETVTNRLSQVTRYVFSGGQLTNARLPSSSSTNRLTVQYTSGKVSYVSSTLAGDEATYYTYSDVSGVRSTTISPATGNASVVKTNLSSGWTTEYWQDTSGTRKTVLTRDGDGRVTRTTLADGRYIDVTYDARGNITQTTRAPKTGSGLSNITTTASYPSTCSNAKTCNQPDSTTDARGYRTDYTYSSTHGGVLTITLPAPSGSAPVGSGTRPETRFTYGDAGTGIIRLATVASCATGSSCASASNETLQSLSYDGQRRVTTATARAGDWSAYAISTLTYTPQGDVATIDGPLSGSGDTTTFYYDDLRRLRATVGPDPDGGSSMLHRVAKTDYNVDGQATTVQLGSVSSPSSWASLTVLQQQDLVYNASGLLATSKLASLDANPPHAVSQYEYNVGASMSCSATRMNPSTFSSLPSSACNAATTGSFGPDRRSRPTRSGYMELTDIQDAYGTPEQRATTAATYTTSGELETLKDAKNNKTTYEYDGFGRLVKTRYPHPSTANTSSTTDYEQLTYDAYGRLTARRGRDGQSFAYSYDNLGRVTLVDAPGAQPDVSYTYDNFGRMTQAYQTGHANSFVYDALSRLTSETQAGRTVAYEYDLAGRRTKMTWPGSSTLYVTYDYNTAGDLIAIKENGGTALATFAYDNAGRRTSLTRSNGGVTGYGFNTASWLTSIAIAPANATYNNYVSLSYNPAGQIVSRTPTNASYLYAPPASYTDSYTSNGLNQYTSARGATPTYTDARGNMTYDGVKTYGYDYSNRMISASGSPGATLSYDPLGRLYEVVASSTTRFVYDGVDVIAEYDASGNVLRRYVHGPGLDEPLVWFEGAGHSGSGTPDRRHLYADERGSIIAVEGSGVAINKYDSYGIPASGNTGRFQYTGQMWLPEVGLYHYKARAYSPQLGRFMQTDPIGYADGMNMYAYVGNDPYNRIDPFGFYECDPNDTSCVQITATFTGECYPSDDACWRRLSDERFFRFLFWPVDVIVLAARDAGSAAKDAGCTVGNIDIGAGADAYAGVGGSVGASVKLDFTTGQTGLDVYAAVGVGEGVSAGPTITSSSSGNQILTANVIAQGSGGAGLSVTGTRTLLGTNPNQTSVTVGKVSTPGGFVNVGGAVGAHTPQLYDLGC